MPPSNQQWLSPSLEMSYRQLSTSSPDRTRSASTSGTSRPDQSAYTSYLDAPQRTKINSETKQIPFGSATSDSLWDSRLLLSNSILDPLTSSVSHKSSANLSCLDYCPANYTTSNLQKQITSSTADSVQSRFASSPEDTVDPAASFAGSGTFASSRLTNASSLSIKNVTSKSYVEGVSTSDFSGSILSPVPTSSPSRHPTSAKPHFQLNACPKTQTGIPKPIRPSVKSLSCEGAGGSFLDSYQLSSERNTPSYFGSLQRRSPDTSYASDQLRSSIHIHNLEDRPEYELSSLRASNMRHRSPLTTHTSPPRIQRATSVDVLRSTSLESQRKQPYRSSLSMATPPPLQRRQSPFPTNGLTSSDLTASTVLNASHEIHSDVLSRPGQPLHTSLSRSGSKNVQTQVATSGLHSIHSALIASTSSSSSKSSNIHQRNIAAVNPERVLSGTRATACKPASAVDRQEDASLNFIRGSGLRLKSEDKRSGEQTRDLDRNDRTNHMTASDRMFEGLQSSQLSFPITGSKAWRTRFLKDAKEDGHLASDMAKLAPSKRERTPRVDSYLEFLKQLYTDKEVIPPDMVCPCLLTLASHSIGLPFLSEGTMPWCCVADFEVECGNAPFELPSNESPRICVKDQVVAKLFDTILRRAVLLSVQEQDVQRAFTATRTLRANREQAYFPCESLVSLSLKATAEEGVVMSLVPLESLPRNSSSQCLWKDRLLPLSSCSTLLLCLAALEGPCGVGTGCSNVHVNYSRVVFALQQEMCLRSAEADPFDVCTAFIARSIYPWGPLIETSLLPAGSAFESWVGFNYDVSALMVLALAGRSVELVTANQILLQVSKHISSCSPMGLAAWFSGAALLQLNARDHPEIFARTSDALEAETKQLPLGALLADVLWSLIMCGIPLKSIFEQAAPAIAAHMSLFSPEDLCLIACCYALYVRNSNMCTDRCDLSKHHTADTGSNCPDIAREAPFCFVTRKPSLKTYCLLCAVKMADSGTIPSVSSVFSSDAPTSNVTPKALLQQLIDHGAKIVQGFSSSACQMLEFCKAKAEEAAEEPYVVRQVAELPQFPMPSPLPKQKSGTDTAPADHTRNSHLGLADRCGGRSERGVLQQDSPLDKAKVKDASQLLSSEGDGTTSWRYVTTKVVSLLRRLQSSPLSRICNISRKVSQINDQEGVSTGCPLSECPTSELSASHGYLLSELHSKTDSEDFKDVLHDSDIGEIESTCWGDEPIQDEYDGSYSDVFPSARPTRMDENTQSYESMTAPGRSGLVGFVFDCGAFIAHACMGYVCIMIALCGFSLWRDGR